MAGDTSVDPARLPGGNPAAASPDPLRALVQAQRRGADAHQGRGAAAPYGQPSEQRVNSCNRYRPRRWDTRAATIDLAIPTLCQGYLQNSWKMPGVRIRQIWNGARIDQNRA